MAGDGRLILPAVIPPVHVTDRRRRLLPIADAVQRADIDGNGKRRAPASGRTRKAANRARSNERCGCRSDRDIDHDQGEGEGEGEDDKAYNTLGGLVMYVLGRIPGVADRFEVGGHAFEIVDMDKNRVDKVLLSAMAQPAPANS